jgi:pimeloyl-ACP methyl ester carboxylesterase
MLFQSGSSLPASLARASSRRSARPGRKAISLFFDKRGTDLSDCVSAMPTLEERMDDVRAVMDAVGSERAAIFGYSEGGPMSILFSATYPKRTSAMILYGSMARWAWSPDNPWGRTDEQFQAAMRST